jgi:glycerol-3-phosphate dehydrogenase
VHAQPHTQDGAHDPDLDLTPGVRRAARDRLDGRAYEFSARVVVNCTGAWSPITAATAGVSQHVRVRPGKGVHLVLDRPVTDVGVMAEAIDGRQIFIEPWGNTSLIGTTDDDTYADLDDLPVTTDEVRYLLEGVETVLPRVKEARIVGTTVAARPHHQGDRHADTRRDRKAHSC